MKTAKLKLLILAASILMAGSASAATLAQYNFTSGSTASSDTELLTTASSITSGAGLNPAFTGNRVEIGGDDTAGSPSSTDTVSQARDNALAQNSFLTFTLSIGSGKTVDLSSIGFNYSSSSEC